MFAIAERVWGPLEDVYQLLTYNHTQPVHIKRVPVLSFSLLTQVARVGRVAISYQAIYTKFKWDGVNVHLRRELTSREEYALRRAIYRLWLYAKAFHTDLSSRTMRLNPALVADRCQLLRTWSTDELIELEDVRSVIEFLAAAELCPTDGEVYWKRGGEQWPGGVRYKSQSPGSSYSSHSSIQDVFYDSRHETVNADNLVQYLPASQRREQSMDGWGDQIDQYHLLKSLLKLTPAEILWLYENAITKQDIEYFIAEKIGGGWFWNNGETLVHTWILVLYSRGIDVEDTRNKIAMGLVGVSVDQGLE